MSDVKVKGNSFDNMTSFSVKGKKKEQKTVTIDNEVKSKLNINGE